MNEIFVYTVCINWINWRIDKNNKVKNEGEERRNFLTYNNRMIFKTHEWKGDGERMRNLFETETTISLCSQRQRASLCKLFAYRYVLYSFHQKFYEITFTYDTLHLLLTHHDKHANFYLHSAPRASISITILIPYRLAVKYLFFFFLFATRYNLDRSISSIRNEWVILLHSPFSRGQRTWVFEVLSYNSMR